MRQRWEPAANENRTEPDRKSAWLLAGVGLAGVVAGAVITGLFSHFDHARDIDAKMIELTVGILRSKPEPESMPLREWAIDTLQERANFRFTPLQMATLKNQKLPATFWEPFGASVNLVPSSTAEPQKQP